MKNLQKWGGVAALIDAATYLLAIGLFATVLAPMGNTELAFGQFMAFFMGNQTIIFIWHLLMYLVNGTFLVILALALYERLKVGSPAMAQVATVLGLCWAVMVFASGFITIYGFEVLATLYGNEPAQAGMLKIVLDTITLGIDHSDRFLGCLWVILISLAALQSGALPKPLNYLGLLIGVPGVVSTVFPAITEVGIAFGLGIIVWWCWLGITLLRSSSNLSALPMRPKEAF
jgi:Domain of unknown function (DUF4386)